MPGANLSRYNLDWYLHSQKENLSSRGVQNPQSNYYYNKSIYVANKYTVFLGGGIVDASVNWLLANSYVANIRASDEELSELGQGNIVGGLVRDRSDVYDFSTVISKIEFPKLNLITDNGTYYNPVSLQKESVPVQAITDGDIHIIFEENQEYYVGMLLEKMMAAYLSKETDDVTQGGNNSGKIGNMRRQGYVDSRNMYDANLEGLNTGFNNQMISGITIVVANMVAPRQASVDKDSGIDGIITSDNGFGDLVPLHVIMDAKPVSVTPVTFDHSSMTPKTWDLLLKCNPVTDDLDRYWKRMEGFGRAANYGTYSPTYVGSDSLADDVMGALKSGYKKSASNVASPPNMLTKAKDSLISKVGGLF
jgi:hypothetical protein